MDPKNIQHLANLARLKLKPEEGHSLGNELSQILNFVTTLNETDISEVRLLEAGSRIKNVMREDAKAGRAPGEEGRNLAEIAPKNADGYVRVPAIFKR